MIYRARPAENDNEFDASSPEAIIQKIFKDEWNGTKTTPEKLGKCAGDAVLHQYMSAKKEISRHWWQTGGNLLKAGTAIAAYVTDAIVYCGSFYPLTQSVLQCVPFAVGPLMFASGIGLSRASTRKLYTGIMVGASLGASVITASTFGIQDHVRELFPDSMRTSISEAAINLNEAKKRADASQIKIDSDYKQIIMDGQKGLLDSSKSQELWKKTLPEDEAHLRKAMEDQAVAKVKSAIAQNEDPTSFWGHAIGAILLSAWLITSQLYLAKLIEKSQASNRNKDRLIKKLWCKDMESSRGDACARVKVHVTLGHFHVAMLSACNQGLAPEKARDRRAEIDNLFSGKNLEDATLAGVQMVRNFIRPNARNLRL